MGALKGFSYCCMGVLHGSGCCHMGACMVQVVVVVSEPIWFQLLLLYCKYLKTPVVCVWESNLCGSLNGLSVMGV
jgi:hypothetical protein